MQGVQLVLNSPFFISVEHPALKITDLHGEDIPGRTNTLSYCFSAILFSKLSDTISRYLFKIQNAGRFNTLPGNLVLV